MALAMTLTMCITLRAGKTARSHRPPVGDFVGDFALENSHFWSVSSCGACFLYKNMGFRARGSRLMPLTPKFFGLDIGSSMPSPSCNNLFVELPHPRVIGPTGAYGSGDNIDHVHYTSRRKNPREVTDPQSVTLSVTLR